jgi:ATP-dependent DNA helicase RecG
MVFKMVQKSLMSIDSQDNQLSFSNHQLFQNYITDLKINARFHAPFKKLVGDRLIDLLFHLPSNLETRQHQPFINNTTHGDTVTLTAKVLQHEPSDYGSRRPYRIICHDGHQKFELVFFKIQYRYLERVAPKGDTICISGKITATPNGNQFYHPDHMGPAHTFNDWIGTSPIYPQTAGITSRTITQTISAAISKLEDIPEWLPSEIIDAHNFNDFKSCLMDLHTNPTDENLSALHKNRLRLAFDEMLAHELALILTREDRPPLQLFPKNTPYSPLMNDLVNELPFELTQCQKQAIQEILNDLNSLTPMLRLVQGDVGSGKTLVALMTALFSIQNGHQVALLVPTEILARQHFENIKKLTNTLPINVAVLISKDKASTKKQILDDLESGHINLIIGTHAIIQDAVAFNNLGFIIIDEQHRFGVEQRLKLSEKGKTPNVLSMTATPIPRTLTLTQYGDMDVSVIRQKPPGRKPITTKVISLERLDEVISNIKKRLEIGDKIYWVCPLIEESESSDMAAAVQRHMELNKVFDNTVGLIHGKMTPTQKQETMSAFTNGDIKILVSTTVIEVGVDVKDASIMIIEQAERFGLSQLHQLRGRVGRGEKPSVCLLLFGQKLTFHARKRLEAMRETEDGFLLAEADLRLRGAGEITGTKQSGLPQLKFSDLQSENDALFDLYSKFLEDAHALALKIADNDPKLSTDDSAKYRFLLKVFKKDKALEYKRAG